MKRNFGILIAILLTTLQSFAQQPVAELPIELYGDFTFIKVKVNGSPELDYIFDTGDGLAILDLQRAAELGITSGSNETITSAEGSISGKRVKHNEFLIGGAPIHNVVLHETDLTHLEMSVGREIDGIIGYDLLKNYVVELNYDELKMKLYDPSGYRYTGTGRQFPIKLTSYIPHIPAKVTFANGEVLEGEFFVDTGAKTTVDFNTPYVEKHGLADKIGESYIYLVAGLGDTEYEHHRGTVNGFEFSGFDFRNMPVGLSHAKHGIQNHKKISGILGGALLKKFNMVYDYHSKHMYWEKNESYADGFAVNCSGLELQLSKDKKKVLVHKVFENSPADEAGIALDASLESVNGKSASELGLSEIRDILSQSGQRVSLVIDGKPFELTLRALL